MGLIKCPECAKELSSSAMSCPSCGYPISTAMKGCTDYREKIPVAAQFCSKCGVIQTGQKASGNIDNKMKVTGAPRVSHKNLQYKIFWLIVAGIPLLVFIGLLTNTRSPAPQTEAEKRLE
jgi:hypothetical protein